jgi:hypothetical protein
MMQQTKTLKRLANQIVKFDSLISSNGGYLIEPRKNLFLDIVQKYKDEYTGYRGNGKRQKQLKSGKFV